MPTSYPRSPYDETLGLVYFPRMLDKIRRQAAGELGAEYLPMLGDGFDLRCLHLLRVAYEDVVKRTLQGGTDDEVLQWCYAQGFRPNEEEIEIWNGFMTKRGWRDTTRERIDFRLHEAGKGHLVGEVATMFDFIDLDEGRTPPDFKKLEPPRV